MLYLSFLWLINAEIIGNIFFPIKCCHSPLSLHTREIVSGDVRAEEGGRGFVFICIWCCWVTVPRSSEEFPFPHPWWRTIFIFVNPAGRKLYLTAVFVRLPCLRGCPSSFHVHPTQFPLLLNRFTCVCLLNKKCIGMNYTPTLTEVGHLIWGNVPVCHPPTLENTTPPNPESSHSHWLAPWTNGGRQPLPWSCPMIGPDLGPVTQIGPIRALPWDFQTWS